MKILVIQARPGIGDMCIFLPVIHQIAKLENSKITILTKKRSSAKELTKFDPNIEEVIYFPKKKNLQFVNFLKTKKFSKCYIFHYGLKFYLLSKLINVNKIYYYGFFKKKTNISIEGLNQLKKWFNKKNIKPKCEIFLKNTIPEKEKSLIIGIGGSGPTKKWNIENYLQLITRIQCSNKDIKILIAGGNEDYKNYLYLSKFSENKNLMSLCEKKIDECIQYISSCKLYVGNDTGFMHLSGMLGVKSYGLFGDTPINYCDYNDLIFPIIPEKRSEIFHNSRAIDEISVDWVMKNIELDIKNII